MNKKQAERIATIALAAFLVGMFFYQAAHAMTETVGPNGTMTVTGPNNIMATITAPPGSTVSNVTITPLPHMVDLTGTWHFGAAGTITFRTAAAIASIVIGSTLRMILYFLITIAPSSSPYANYAGLDTIIPPIVSLAVFVGVSLATQKRSPPRHDVVYLIPSDMDSVTGADVSEWVNPIDVRLVKKR